MVSLSIWDISLPDWNVDLVENDDKNRQFEGENLVSVYLETIYPSHASYKFYVQISVAEYWENNQ